MTAAAKDRRLVCPDCGRGFTPAARDLSSVRPLPNREGVTGPGQLAVRCPHCGSLRAVHWGDGRESD